jgi:hypothetical protein
MKIYIAGAYSTLTHQAAVDKFAETERQLISAGISHENIVNPMKLCIHKDTQWDEAMAVCMEQLKKCNAIFIQRDWKDSFGARHEITYADQNKYDMYWEIKGDIAKITNIIKP